MQKKTEAMFRPEGITLDFGQGKNRYIAFERSASMSRNAKLSFVREDIYDRLKERITVGLKLGVCQLSKLYAYNGLMFSSYFQNRKCYDHYGYVGRRTSR